MMYLYNNKYYYEYFDSVIYENDIFQSIINSYNPYLQVYNDPINILKNKCYYKLYNNNGILIYVNSILNNIKISNMTMTSNLTFIHKNYIIGFMTETLRTIKKTNNLYHYYNKFVNLTTFVNILNNYLIVNTYDELSWILLCYKLFIDNNLLNGEYNNILIIADFILLEMINFSKKIHKYVNNNLYSIMDIKSSVYVVKNIIFYGDDGKYFINNNIFDCKNI